MPRRCQTLLLFTRDPWVFLWFSNYPMGFVIPYCCSKDTHSIETPCYPHQNCVQAIGSSSHRVPDANPRLEQVATCITWLGLADTRLQPKHGNRVSCEDLPTPRIETKENISKFCVPHKSHKWPCTEKHWQVNIAIFHFFLMVRVHWQLFRSRAQGIGQWDLRPQNYIPRHWKLPLHPHKV